MEDSCVKCLQIRRAFLRQVMERGQLVVQDETWCMKISLDVIYTHDLLHGLVLKLDIVPKIPHFTSVPVAFLPNRLFNLTDYRVKARRPDTVIRLQIHRLVSQKRGLLWPRLQDKQAIVLLLEDLGEMSLL